jgi:cobalt-zinc-cadmium efflux system outer membrane protein
MKTFSVLALYCASASAPFAQAQTNPAAVTVSPAFISRLAEELRTNSPALLAASSRTRAAEFNAAGIRIWDDPMLYMGTQVADQAMKADEGNLIYGISQKFPLFGKPQAMRRAAEAEASVERAGASYAFQTSRRDLAQSLFQTALAERVVQIGELDRTWLETILSSVDARYRAGQVALTYLVQAQNELARRTNQLITDRRLLDNAQYNLNRILNRPPQSAWPALGLPEIADSVDFTPELLRLSLTYEPKAQMLREQARAAEAMTQVSRKARYPEVGLDFEGRNYTGNGDFRQAMILVNVTFPLGNAAKYRRDIWRDEDRARAARYEVVDQELAVRQEIHSLTVSIDAARREALLYRDEIIPRSVQALAAAQSDWETSRSSFREVLEARRMLLDARLMLARATTEQWRMLSDLTLCCGLGDLEALLMLRPNGIAAPKPASTSTPPK